MKSQASPKASSAKKKATSKAAAPSKAPAKAPAKVETKAKAAPKAEAKPSWADTMKKALEKKQPAGGFPDQPKPRDSGVQKVKKNAF